MGDATIGSITPEQLFSPPEEYGEFAGNVGTFIGNWSAAFEDRHGRTALMDLAERARELYHYDRDITAAVDEILATDAARQLNLTSMHELPFRVGVLVSLEMMRLGSSMLMPAMVDSALPVPMVLFFGSDDLKQRVLEGVTTNGWHGAYAQTEPGAGSYLAAIKLRATKDESGQWRLQDNTMKTFISNGPIADFFVVLAVTDPEAHAQNEHAGMSWFYVERGADGLSTSDAMHKLGIHQSPTGDVMFNNTPATLIGEEGAGWEMAMRILQRSRNWVGVQGAGLSLLAYDVASRYMEERMIGPYRLGDLPDPKKKLLGIRARYVASRLLVELGAEAFDSCEGESYHAYDVDASIAKMFGTERGVESVRLAKEILGGMGYSNETVIPEAVTFAEVTVTYEGPAATQRQIIAGKGLSRLTRQMQADGVDLKKLRKAKPEFLNSLIDTYSVAWPMSRLSDEGQEDWLVTVDPGDALSYEGLSYRMYSLRRRYLAAVLRATPMPSMKDAVKGLGKFYANFFSPTMPAYWHDIAEALTSLEAATLTLREYAWSQGEGLADLPVVTELVELAEEAMDTAEKQLEKAW